MTTPYTQRGPLAGARRHPEPTPTTRDHHPPQADPPQVDLLGLVVHARREPLLRAHRHRLRRADLEDCYSQATLEILAHLRRGGRPFDRRHLDRVLEQRFLSRVRDRRRALHGRSAIVAALEHALPLDTTDDDTQLADPRADVHTIVARRRQLGALLDSWPALSPDERLVLVAQALLGIGRAEFCRHHGWSFEKYRKVALRARTRLRALSQAEISFPQPPPADRCPTSAGRSE